MEKVKPLSGRGKEIFYEFNEDFIKVTWSDARFKLKKSIIEDIIDKFFIDKNEWYLLGACVDNPIKNGLGEYIVKEYRLTPRHASAIAAILYNEGLIEFRGKKPIELKIK